MRFFKKVVAASLTSIILLSTTIMANAETSQLHNSEAQLQENAKLIEQKQAEKESLLTEVNNLQSELQTLENDISNNKKEMTNIEQKISEIKQIIEQKKEEIVVLEDKVLARKGVMEERLVSLQHNDKASLVIEILVNSENLTELVQRATAVTTILNADKSLLEQQQSDLKKIEEEKAAIDQQEQLLQEQYATLASNHALLEGNMQKRQAILTTVQEKYNSVVSAIKLAEEENAAIQARINEAQARLAKEQQEAAARATAITQHAEAQQPAPNTAATNNSNGTKANTNSNTNSNTSSGKELYVSATAYSHESSATGLTATGINVRQNPNMKLIAVDPSVIPLGSRVWVEGYGEAIAGDTGGAIKGHKIDVLMPSTAACIAWGRKTVKIVILD
ncbi:3D domain-containing protein [Niallia endozanthoxylica]|uniref:Radical SAM protein n=1 Tax=Niallia endozanthoxylica TaxID=2036016 RepID=A0A5J5H942_9BACI|nr:3D domain-containing protein [Niallia endozanthoxylica]KAA9015974.1 radical SAM protein [Niallia endozanthoxylica]